MLSDFRFSAAAGEQTGLVAPSSDPVDEAYLKGLYAGMQFSSVSRWDTPFFFGGGGGGGGVPPGYHSFSSIPVETEGLVPYESLCGFSSEIEARPEMNVWKQDDDGKSYTGMFDLQKLIHSGNNGEIDDEIYPKDAGSVVDFISPAQISSLDESNQGFTGRFGTVLPLLESFEQYHSLKSQPQTPLTRMFSPPINLPLTVTEPRPSSSSSSAAAAAAKPNFIKRLKTTPAHSSAKQPSGPSPYYKRSWAETKSTEGDRRRRISQKTRCLQNLIPGCEKFDIATMLEEAYKYIKFLQAQFIALHSMPIHDGGSSTAPPPDNGGGCSDAIYGKLGKLNRQQLLQLMVNSSMVQTVLFTRGRCVYSVEQLNYLSSRFQV